MTRLGTKCVLDGSVSLKTFSCHEGILNCKEGKNDAVHCAEIYKRRVPKNGCQISFKKRMPDITVLAFLDMTRAFLILDGK